MSRRKSDKAQPRLIIGLVALNAITGLLAAVIGYKAIPAIDGFHDLMQDAAKLRRAKATEDF